MECKENLMVSLRRAGTGVRRRRSVNVIGSVVSTSSKGAVLATSPNNLVLQRMRFTSGFTNTASADGMCPKPASSSIGAQTVRTTPCGTSEASSTRDGWVVSPRNGKRSTRVTSGSVRVRLCGNATARVAAGVGFTATSSRICRSTSTTSHHLPFFGFVLTPPISFCFARCATTSSIHGGM